MRVVLIGAGVAGGVIARGLRGLPGIELTMVERVSADDHASAGNGLNIGPNALLALDRVLPEMAAELRAASLPWTRWRAALIDGTPIYETKLAEVGAGPGIRIRWSELYRIARAHVAALTRYDHRCVDVAVAPGAAGKARVTLERVSSGGIEVIDDIDLVIACDGRYSVVRELSCGAPAIRHLGVANFRTLTDDADTTGIDDLEQWYHGPNRLFAFRLPDRRLYVTGTFPIDAGREIPDHQKTAAFLRTLYRPADGSVDPRCEFLVDVACRQLDALHWSRFQDIDMRFHDSSGRLLFVGDSAHAMAPTLGQGATQAIEDGCALVGLFSVWRASGNPSVGALTAEFDRLRRDRVGFVKQLSWDASTALLAGSDTIAANRSYATPAYRAKLRQLYTELGFEPTTHRAA